MGVDRRKLVNDDRIRDWYFENVNADFFNDKVAEFEEHGFKLDRKSGLLVRNYNSCKRTLFDVMILRPLGLCYQEDVSEDVLVVDGRGEALISEMSQGVPAYGRYPLKRGSNLHISACKEHSFKPSENNFLLLNVKCDGVWDPKNEVQVKPFYDESIWSAFCIRRS